MKTKKWVFAKNWSVFSSKSGEDLKSLHRNLGLYSAGICRIYSCWLALDRFIIQRSNLDGGRLNLDGGTLNFDGGTLTLDGGARPPASPYNLSTSFIHPNHSGLAPPRYDKRIPKLSFLSNRTKVVNVKVEMLDPMPCQCYQV